MIRASIFILLICVSFYSLGQSLPENTASGKAHIFGFVGVGRSTVKTNIFAPTNFPALEVRLGAGLHKPLSKYFALKSRLTFGSRLKRGSDAEAVFDARFSAIDESRSNRNHYFLEIPLLVQVNFPQIKSGVRAGGNYRQYLPTKPVDIVSGQSEFGIVAGVFYEITDKIDIGLDYYIGVSKIYTGGGNIDGQEYEITARNRFAQLTLEIKL